MYRVVAGLPATDQAAAADRVAAARTAADGQSLLVLPSTAGSAAERARSHLPGMLCRIRRSIREPSDGRFQRVIGVLHEPAGSRQV